MIHTSTSSFSKSARGTRRVPDFKNAFFNQISPFNEDAMCALATEGVPGIKWAYINTAVRDQKRFQLTYDGVNLRDIFDINFIEGTIANGNMECRLRDRVTGRRMYANRMAVGLVLGLREVHNTSSSMMGGYVWARAGMYVKPHEYADLRESLLERLEALEVILDPAMYKRVAKLCALRRKTDLKAIASLDLELPFIGDTFDNVRDADSCDEIVPFKKYQRRGFFKSGSMTLGQFLLAEQDYQVYADLHDPVQMKKIETYCGVPVRARAQEFLSANLPARPVKPAPRTARPL